MCLVGLAERDMIQLCGKWHAKKRLAHFWHAMWHGLIQFDDFIYAASRIFFLGLLLWGMKLISF